MSVCPNCGADGTLHFYDGGEACNYEAQDLESCSVCGEVFSADDLYDDDELYDEDDAEQEEQIELHGIYESYLGGVPLCIDEDLEEGEGTLSFFIASGGGEVVLDEDAVKALVTDLQAFLARQAEGAGEK